MDEISGIIANITLLSHSIIRVKTPHCQRTEEIFLNPEKIAFLVDSCAELEQRHREGLPVYVVPLRITCEDGSYNDGETIFPADIYRRLESGELPKTSLPEPARVAETLKHIKADG